MHKPEPQIGQIWKWFDRGGKYEYWLIVDRQRQGMDFEWIGLCMEGPHAGVKCEITVGWNEDWSLHH